MATDASYQRYLLLSNQQQYLRRRLSLQIPATSMAPTTPAYTSLSCSPTSHAQRSSFASYAATPMSPSSRQTSISYAISAIPGYAHHRGSAMPFNGSDVQLNDDSKALYEVNQQIKATLTELLNNDSVKHDEKFRSWIQCQLMDAEMELKRQRRRRSSASVDNKEVAESIAEHFDSHHGTFRWSP